MEFIGSFQELNKIDEVNTAEAIAEVDRKLESEDLVKSYSDLLDCSLKTRVNLALASKHSNSTSQVNQLYSKHTVLSSFYRVTDSCILF